MHPKLKKAAAPQTSSATDTAVQHDRCASLNQIRERAFQLFENRGSKHGHDMQDWLRAERQILAN
jgi:hypothetical protein